MKDRLEQIEKMIDSIQNELKSNSSADQKRNQRMLLKMYLKKREELIKGLCAFGVTKNVEIRYIDEDRIEIHVNGEYFGVWDEIRKTFVD